MPTATSDVTGLPIRTKAKTDSYDAGWEALFNKSPVPLREAAVDGLVEKARPKEAIEDVCKR
jgi:hypothetical protein